jgi:multimeric flavodoxin WrbA
MKTVCVLGSPRPKGNSTKIAEHFCDKLETLGASIQTFALNKMSYKGCQACMTCKTKLDRCVLQDDLTEVLDALHDADVIVMASPVYFSDVTSQMKAFIDRVYSFLTPEYRESSEKSRFAPGKTLVFIQVQGRPDEKKFADIFPRYEEFFDWYGINKRFLIRAWGVRNLGEIDDRQEVFQQAEDMAVKIMTGKDAPR